MKPLATNDQKKGTIELDPTSSLLYQFVVESKALRSLPSGDYHVVAMIDTTRKRNMWQGISYSKSVIFSLSDPHPDPDWRTSNQRALLHSTYFIEDKQFIEAEKHARSWIALHPDSIDAWGQLGEALYGQDKNTEALEAFRTSEAKFRLKYGDTPFELPMELIDRIDEIKEKLPPGGDVLNANQ